MISFQIYWSIYELIIISFIKKIGQIYCKNKMVEVFAPQYRCFKGAVEHTNLSHSAADSKYGVLQQRLSRCKNIGTTCLSGGLQCVLCQR